MRWRIEDGVLVARRGAAATATSRSTSAACPATSPGEARLHVEVEVANFYPAIASTFSPRVYTITQSRIHVIVTHGFLRSLARARPRPSRVGRFAATTSPAAPAPSIAEVAATRRRAGARPSRSARR